MEINIGNRTIKLNGNRARNKKEVEPTSPIQTACFNPDVLGENDEVILSGENEPVAGSNRFIEEDLPEEYQNRNNRAVVVQPNMELEQLPPHLTNRDAMMFHFENKTRFSLYFQNAHGVTRMSKACDTDRTGEAFVYYKESSTNKTQVYKFTEAELKSTFHKPFYLETVDMAVTTNPSLNHFHPRMVTFENLCSMTMNMLKTKNNYAGALFSISNSHRSSYKTQYVIYKNHLYPVKNTVSNTSGDMLVIAESDGLSHSTASFVIGSGDEANRFYYRGQPVYWFLKKEDAEKQLERLTSENSSMYDQVQMNALTENLNRTKEELEKINAEHTAEIVSLQEHHGKALVKLEETLAENRTKLKSYEATKVIQEDLNNQMLQTVKATRDVHKQVTDVAVSSNRSSAAASSVEKEELSVWKAGLGVLAAGVGLAFILGKKSAI